MVHKILRLLAAQLLAPLLLVCATTADAQTRDWEVRVTPFNQVFPALELSQAGSTHAHPNGLHKSDANVRGAGTGLVGLARARTARR